ncbi:MAG: MBL fold metallo-hydrolase [Patescibacteria group bacterium]
MVITYYGISCFKIQSGDTTLAIDPFDKESGLTPPRFRTDIALTTHNHSNHNNIDSLADKEDINVFKITGPGEYEIHGIQIHGVSSFHDAKEGKEKGKNTIYIITWENLRIVHLGDYGENTLRDEIHEAIGTPDILFVPVGGGDTIDAEMATKLINQIEPRIIIPMHYKIPGLKEKISGVEVFMKEMGEKSIPEERLTIKKSAVPTDSQKIIVLKTP